MSPSCPIPYFAHECSSTTHMCRRKVVLLWRPEGVLEATVRSSAVTTDYSRVRILTMPPCVPNTHVMLAARLGGRAGASIKLSMVTCEVLLPLGLTPLLCMSCVW